MKKTVVLRMRRAGFSIDGISPETGEKVTWLLMHPRTYFIGESAGNNTTTNAS